MLPRLRLLTLSPTGPIVVGSLSGAMPLPSTLLLSADTVLATSSVLTPSRFTVSVHAGAGSSAVTTGGMTIGKSGTED